MPSLNPLQVSTMLPTRLFLPVLLGVGVASGVVPCQTPPSHLPQVAPGYFNVSSSILINAPIEKVWNILLDFPKYSEWNPFVRKQVVTDASFIPIEDQTPKEGGYMVITSQIPPIEGPVDANTQGDPLKTQNSTEKITHLNTPEPYQVAWKFHPPSEIALSAERWSAVSVFKGQTYYETSEVFDGALAPTVKSLQGDGLQKGFDAQAKALKARVESMG